MFAWATNKHHYLPDVPSETTIDGIDIEVSDESEDTDEFRLTGSGMVDGMSDGVIGGRASRDVGAMMWLKVGSKEMLQMSMVCSSKGNEDDEADECGIEDGSL